MEITSHCRLKAVLDEAKQAFYSVLEQYSLADLVRNRAALSRILFHAPQRATH